MSDSAWNLNSSNLNVGAIILAGGKSSRMGVDKASLKVGEQPLVFRLQAMLASLGLSVVISSKHYGVADIIPDKGPLGGCYTGMMALTDCHHVMVIPVDMVHLTKDVLLRLLERATDNQIATITKYQGQHFPFVIRNTPQVTCWLRDTLSNQGGKACSVGALLNHFGTEVVTTEDCFPQCFNNVNTPLQWHQALNTLNCC